MTIDLGNSMSTGLGLGRPGAATAGLVQPCPKPWALFHKHWVDCTILYNYSKNVNFLLRIDQYTPKIWDTYHAKVHTISGTLFVFHKHWVDCTILYNYSKNVNFLLRIDQYTPKIWYTYHAKVHTHVLSLGHYL